MEKKSKLVLAVLQGSDSDNTIRNLNERGFMVTVLSSTGGFLKKKSTTVMIGVEEDRLDEALKIVHERCKTKKQMTIANQPYTSTPEGYIPYPIEVTAGGATVFVIDVEQFYKF